MTPFGSGNINPSIISANSRNSQQEGKLLQQRGAKWNHSSVGIAAHHQSFGQEAFWLGRVEAVYPWGGSSERPRAHSEFICASNSRIRAACASLRALSCATKSDEPGAVRIVDALRVDSMRRMWLGTDASVAFVDHVRRSKSSRSTIFSFAARTSFWRNCWRTVLALMLRASLFSGAEGSGGVGGTTLKGSKINGEAASVRRARTFCRSLLRQTHNPAIEMRDNIPIRIPVIAPAERVFLGRLLYDVRERQFTG
ncbi:hypothetical protein FB451DRAFT_1188903 [Mycena latifolia]|nr:hypothetical protein FB451DRAFT_1188903 [Mycena latifolia]